MVNLCLAELVGVVPFAGGSFGFVRCSLGPFWGFVAANVERVVYILYTVRSVQKLAQLVTVAALTSPHMEKVWVLCAYVALMCLHIRGGNLFWGTMLGCTLFTFLLLGVYIVGSLMEVDFYRYALDGGHSNGFEPIMVGNSAEMYMQYANSPMWFYLGICVLPLTGQRVKDAHINIPRAIIAGLFTMFAIAVLAVFCMAGLSPGVSAELPKIKFTLKSSLERVFHIDEKWVALMLMVPTFASSAGFMFASKHQLAAMAESGLTHQIFKMRFGPNKTPIFAIMATTLLQYSVFLAIDHYLITNYTVTFRLCCTAACMAYILLMIAFITFRFKFSNMKRHFVNPFGVPGACLGIFIFGQIFVGLVFFDQGNHASIIALLIYLVIVIVNYFAFVQYVQFFSKEEQDKFMKAYILNANQRRKTSKWVKMLTTFFTATGLDKIALRTVSRSKTKTSINALSQSSAGSASAGPQDPLSVAMNAISLRNNKVGTDVSMTGQFDTPSVKAFGASHKSSRQRGQGLSATSLTWSGKHFKGDNESRKAFQLLHHQLDDDEEEDRDNGEAVTMHPGAVFGRTAFDVEEGQENCEAADGKHEMDSVALIADLLIEHFPEQFVLDNAANNGDASSATAVAHSVALTTNRQDLEMVIVAPHHLEEANAAVEAISVRAAESTASAD